MKKRLAKKMMKRQAECAVKAQEMPVIQEEAPVEVKTEPAAAQKPEVTGAKTVKESAAPKKAVKARETAADSKGAKKVNIFYQFSNHEIEQQDIIAKIKNQWKEQGNMLKDLKELVVYLKTEENKAYYIINENIKGFVAVCE